MVTGAKIMTFALLPFLASRLRGTSREALLDFVGIRPDVSVITVCCKDFLGDVNQVMPFGEHAPESEDAADEDDDFGVKVPPGTTRGDERAICVFVGGVVANRILNGSRKSFLFGLRWDRNLDAI